MFAPQSFVTMALLGGLFMLTGLASSSGWGLDAPDVNPPSIREGSVRVQSGRTRTRFFIGGGHRAGK